MNSVARTVVTVLLCWAVSASIVRVVDGDTFVARAFIWPGHEVTVHVRVLGVDTPEPTGATKVQGEQARAFTDNWLGQGDVILVGCKLDSFGRFLGTVTRDGKSLAADLISAGHGVRR